MLIFTEKKSLQSHLKAFLNQKKTIGFVPTMGALHNGHLTLVEQSMGANEVTVVSVFVNPTQFNNAQDLEKYPRNLEQDVTLLQTISDNIIVFNPSAANLYNDEIKSIPFDFGSIAMVMEGEFRPGHFDGVGTVLTHLFEAVKPTNAYFGKKDYQQLLIVKKLVQLNKSNINIIGCEIYRESNGLAFSSRNQLLTDTTKEEAKIIFQTLLEAKKMFGTKNAKSIIDYVEDIFKKNNEFELEYFKIADTENLEITENFDNTKKYRAFIAVFTNQKVRLIDNIALN